MLQYINNIDISILFFIQEHIRNSVLTPIFRIITTSGNRGDIWIILGIILLCFPKSRRTGLAVLLSLLVCQLINNDIVKVLVARPRPFQEWSNLHILIPKPKGFSFPSGHTSSSFAAAGAIYFSGNKKWSIPALILAALIGFSRLYFGVHYPTDVICGALLGFLISFVLSKLVIWPKEI